jgi:hypothetical protein
MSQMPPESNPPQVSAYPGYGQWPQPSRTSAAAVTSLVCGIVGCVPVITSLVAVITGIIGLKATKDPAVRGRGIAIAGLILGILGLLGWGAAGVGGGYAFVATRPQRAMAHDFVYDLANGQVDAAAAMCDAGVTHDQLQAASDGMKKWGGGQIISVTYTGLSTFNGVETADIAGMITVSGSTTHNFRVAIVNAGGTWKISSFSIQ